MVTSQMGQFSATHVDLKEEPRVQCHYQLVASTSCHSVHRRWRRSAHSIYVCDAGATVRSWASRNKSGCVKLLIAVGMDL